jgi:uncharacterized protein (TIGR02271 family)
MRDGSAIVGFFSNQDDAYAAVSELRDAGFTSDQIGLAIRGGEAETGIQQGTKHDSEDRSFWQKTKDFFIGEEHEAGSDEFRQSLGGMDFNADRSDYYSRGIGQGGALVTVRASGRSEEASRILEECGADLRDGGFERKPVADANEIADRDYRVQLRGEMLQAHKDRVNRGEVRLRKEVVSENQSIQVPVTREELVVERVEASGTTPTGEIGSDQEIRVPLSEERVTVQKTPVVTGEVKVGKRQVQDTRTVSDNVRHEEVRLEKEGDVNVNEDALRDKKKGDRAA